MTLPFFDQPPGGLSYIPPVPVVQVPGDRVDNVEKIDNVDNSPTGPGSMSVRLWHPSYNLTHFSALLSMRCFRTWLAGSQRETPIGTRLSGVYKESYWCSEPIRFFAKKGFNSDLANIIIRLQKIKNEIQMIKSTGGGVEIYMHFLGSVNNGDTINSSQLKLLGELGVDLLLEVFPKINWLESPD